MKLAYRIAAAASALIVIAAAVAFFCLKTLYPVKYRAEVNQYAGEYGFKPQLILAVIRTESGFDPKAVSSAGAVGLMQIMPLTGTFMSGRAGMQDFNAESLYEPQVNILLGCAYLRYLYGRFGGDKRLALYAYNAGEGNVAAWLLDPKLSNDGKTLSEAPFKETQRYYEKVTGAEKIYSFWKG